MELFVEIVNGGGDRSSHRRCSVKNEVFRSFAKFTGKHLCPSFFFNKVAGLCKALLLNITAMCKAFSQKALS